MSFGENAVQINLFNALFDIYLDRTWSDKNGGTGGMFPESKLSHLKQTS